MANELSARQRATVAAVLAGPGVTPPTQRQAIARGEAPPELQALTDKIRSAPWTVTDADWAPLYAAYSEDALFELVIAAVVGAAQTRLDAAMTALEGA